MENKVLEPFINEQRIGNVHDAIIDWIKEFYADKGDAKAIVGISGGKDSTVCAALLAEALGPDRVIGVMMPNGEQKDIADSKKVCETLKINSLEVNIGAAYNDLSDEISEQVNVYELPKLYTTNTPARIRMVTLYGVAAIYGGLVVNTCNLSEDFVGYATKYGDAAGDFSLLNRLTKTEVVALGDYMKLPKELIHKTPSDGMCGKSDEDNMGFTYDALDEYILTGIPPKSEEVFNKINKMHKNPNTRLKMIDMPAALGDSLPDAFSRP